MTAQPRIAPAVAMWIGILGAAALAILFFSNAIQAPPHSPDEWETTRARIVEQQLGAEPALRALPETMTPLDRVGDEEFFYAAENQAGGIMLGIVDARGAGMTCGSESHQPNDELSCTSTTDEWHYSAWAQRSSDAPSGFRTRITQLSLRG